MKKLVLFGDSLFGRCGKHLLVALEEKLENNYDIYNCATGGWDSNDVVRKSDYIARLSPDVLIISVGTNDACDWKKVEVPDYTINIEKTLEVFEGSRIIFFPPPPIHELSRPDDKKILNSEMQKYYQAVKEVCEKKDIEYVDSWATFMALQERGESYHVEDGIHLTDHGYDVLFSELRKILL